MMTKFAGFRSGQHTKKELTFAENDSPKLSHNSVSIQESVITSNK